MKIAILGAGFAGLATTWGLIKETQGSVKVDLFDPQPIGGGVSGLSSGLLHSFAGKHARKSWEADRALDQTHRLITEASRGVHGRVILSRGILRPAVTDEQVSDFQATQKAHGETEWWDREKCEQTIPGLSCLGGLYIPQGLSIDVPLYMEGLWQACARMGANFHQTALVKEDALRSYDHIVFALGHAIRALKIFQDVPITPIKGQVLTLGWPPELPPPPMSLVSGGYVVMDRGGKTCHAGATFERTFTSGDPDPELAKQLIFEKVLPFFPALKDAPVLGCRAGVRAASKRQHRPFAGRVGENLWYLTGLGSKGLLYHAWMGEQLAQAILNDDPGLLPQS